MFIISECVELRAKSRANKLWVVKCEEKSRELLKGKTKGVPIRHLQKRIDINDYKDCQFNAIIISPSTETGNEEHQEMMYTSMNHSMEAHSVKESKICLEICGTE